MATWSEVSASINECMDAIFKLQSSSSDSKMISSCAQVLDALHDEQMAVTQKAIAERDGQWSAQTIYFTATTKRLSALSAQLNIYVGYIADIATVIDKIGSLLALVGM